MIVYHGYYANIDPWGIGALLDIFHTTKQNPIVPTKLKNLSSKIYFFSYLYSILLFISTYPTKLILYVSSLGVLLQ